MILQQIFLDKELYAFLGRKVFDGCAQTEFCEIGIKDSFTSKTIGPQFTAAKLHEFYIDGEIYKGPEKACYSISDIQIETHGGITKISGTIGSALEHPLAGEAGPSYSGKRLEGKLSAESQDWVI